MQERHQECENDCGDHHEYQERDHRQRPHDRGHHVRHVLLCLREILLSLDWTWSP
jgi:hypothetical protein